MHRSVFLEETIRELNIQKGKKYIDGTFGEGGHGQRIEQAGGIVLGIEADEKQREKHQGGSISVVHGNFRDIETIAKENKFDQVDGILLDLGLSMEQLNMSRRGLSYRKLEEPLDMRIGETELTVAEVLNQTEGAELRVILMKYSEDQFAESIAQEIVSRRKKNEYRIVSDLTYTITHVLNQNGIYNEQAIEKTYARIFQALRIYVNDEFENLREALEGSMEILNPGGRIVVITFHSLEDRIVKLFAREHAQEMHHRRIEVSRQRELKTFERSAQLRVLEKI